MDTRESQRRAVDKYRARTRQVSFCVDRHTLSVYEDILSFPLTGENIRSIIHDTVVDAIVFDRGITRRDAEKILTQRLEETQNVL